MQPRGAIQDFFRSLSPTSFSLTIFWVARALLLSMKGKKKKKKKKKKTVDVSDVRRRSRNRSPSLLSVSPMYKCLQKARELVEVNLMQ